MSYERDTELDAFSRAYRKHAARCEAWDDSQPPESAWEAAYAQATAEQRSLLQGEQDELNARMEANALDREYAAREPYRWRARLNAWLRDEARRRTP